MSDFDSPWKDALERYFPALELKFGARGKRLMSRVRRVKDMATLQALHQALKTATNLDELRKALPS